MMLTKKDIAVTAACVFVLLMTLGAVRSNGNHWAKALVCMTNQRVLVEGWLGFAEDNDGELVGGTTSEYDWVAPPVWGYSDDQVECEKEGIRQGELYPYIGDLKPYNCPADMSMQLYNGGYRTYAISGPMNGEGWPTTSYPYYVRNYAAIARPSEKYVFVECTDTRGWNMGSWVMYAEPPNWVDPIVIWHQRASTLGFADGHGEIHIWQEESTIWMAEQQIFYFLTPPDEMADVLYMAAGYVPGE